MCEQRKCKTQSQKSYKCSFTHGSVAMVLSYGYGWQLQKKQVLQIKNKANRTVNLLHLFSKLALMLHSINRKKRRPVHPSVIHKSSQYKLLFIQLFKIMQHFHSMYYVHNTFLQVHVTQVHVLLVVDSWSGIWRLLWKYWGLSNLLPWHIFTLTWQCIVIHFHKRTLGSSSI